MFADWVTVAIARETVGKGVKSCGNRGKKGASGESGVEQGTGQKTEQK